MLCISSLANSEVKRVVELHQAKGRKKYGQCIIEGVRAIATAQSCMQLQSLFITQEHTQRAQALAGPTQIYLVTPAVMKKLSTATTPSGFLGVFTIPESPAPDKLGPGLVLARIHDPGNMGTLIRTAIACNIQSVVLIEGADPWSSKVIQASAGTVACAQLFRWTWDQLMQHKKGLKLCALTVHTQTPITKVISPHVLLVVGNEAHGIPDAWERACDLQVTLPMPGRTESLNAAIAGSIALYIVHVLARS